MLFISGDQKESVMGFSSNLGEKNVINGEEYFCKKERYQILFRSLTEFDRE